MCCSCFGDLISRAPGTAPKDGAGFRGKGDYYFLLSNVSVMFIGYSFFAYSLVASSEYL